MGKVLLTVVNGWLIAFVNSLIFLQLMFVLIRLDSETWLELASSFGKNYHGAVGSLDELALFAEHTGKRWIAGKNKLQHMLH